MAKLFMRIVGAVLVVVGLFGFVNPLDGLLSLTALHDLVHLVTGGIALAVSGSEKASIAYAKIFGIVYVLVGIVGLFTTHVFGLIVLEPMDTVIHFVAGIAAIVVGFRSALSTAADARSIRG